MKKDDNDISFKLYVLSCTETGGVYCYHVHNGFDCELVEIQKLPKPMYGVMQDDKLYVILRSPFAGSADSGVVVIDVCEGSLTGKSDLISTYGEVGCHLCVAEGSIYAANYISGSVIRLPDRLIQHNGRSINPIRQESAHTHFVNPTPDGKYICTVDLGMDKIFIYDKNLNPVSSVSAVPGSGPRHIVFSEDGRFAYCANELSSTVSVYSYCSGKLSYIREYSTVPAEYRGVNAPAAIRCHNGYVYVSNRGHDSIACYKICGEELFCTDIVGCGGKSPRDFDIVGDCLICANETDNCVTFFRIADDTLIATGQVLSVESPICVIC